MKKQFALIGVILFQLTHISFHGFSQDSTMNSKSSFSDTSIGKTDTSKYAILYVYRPRNFKGSGESYNLHVNDSVVCRVKNDTKYMIKLFQEGPTKVWAKTEQKEEVDINVTLGQEYFLKCGVKMGIVIGRPELSMVTPEQGRLDFESLHAKNTGSNR